MSETNKSVAEVNSADEQEFLSYEFAFHVLPTVAEGEVASVFDGLKNHITKLGGELKEEEFPKHFDLAYEIEKFLEGKNRHFSSSYFGWVRFKMTASNLLNLQEELKNEKTLLRFLIIKLSKAEEGNPFNFHDSIASRRPVVIDLDESENEESEKDGEENDGNEEGEGENEEVVSKDGE